MRRLTLVISVVGAIVVGLVLLRPVLLSPLTGDDVYYALYTVEDPNRTVVTDFTELPLVLRHRIAIGRVSVLSGLERRVSLEATVKTAVATGRPVHQVQGVVKLGFAALGLLAVYGLLRAIRWRRRDSGTLVQLDSRIRTVAMVAGGLAFAAGAQPLHTGVNGWLSYPVLTWTPAFAIFGVVALALWFARLAVMRGWVIAVPAALLLVVIGLVSNYRYELNFPAVPLTLLALVLIPVSDREHRSAGRRAKWLMGLAYSAGFFPLFVANRMMLSDVCQGGGCYTGVSIALGPRMFRTFAYNVLSTFPGTGRGVVSRQLSAMSIPTGSLWTPTLWSALIALALVATLALVWLAGRRQELRAAEPEYTRAQAMACLMSGLLLILGGLGAAAVMSLPDRSQRLISEVGLLFRHSVVTWAGFAFGIVLLVLALGLWRPRLAVPSFVALALALALVVATRLPADGRVMEFNADHFRPSIAVYDEVVRGEMGDLANQRRCAILGDVDRGMSPLYAPRIRRSAEKSFQRFWHTPFCRHD
jgi:hypothetical protein